MTEERGPCQTCGVPDTDIYFDQLGEGELKSGAACAHHGLKALADLYQAGRTFTLDNVWFDCWEETDWIYLGVCSDQHLAIAFGKFIDEGDAIGSYFDVLADKDCEWCKNLGALWLEKFDEVSRRMWGEPILSELTEPSGDL